MGGSTVDGLDEWIRQTCVLSRFWRETSRFWRETYDI